MKLKGGKVKDRVEIGWVTLKKRTARGLNFFAERLKKEGINVKIQGHREIIMSCGTVYLELFGGPIINSGWKRFLLVFQPEERRKLWYLEDSNRIAINLTCFPCDPEFDKELQELVKGVKATRNPKIQEEV